ncbi:MAG: 6,7-dimethyl-8-ribityllumazine synthase [Candidatus Thermoplasmatota archaeon]|nr:6,7-dimethyl-8-ribityllumazine synthase [Candidatus Thermoplasmatota archaeon]
MKKITIGIVVSEFNYDISMMMLERAKVHAEFLGVAVKTIMNVPGVFDMPLAVDKLLQDKEIDGVVTLGAVIHGETKHDELIIEHTTRKIVDLSVSYKKPVGLGITGPGESRIQAADRIEYAKNAVEAVVKMINKLHE